MTRNGLTGIPGWLRMMAAAGFGFGAAFGLLMYIANGFVVGDLIGLPGCKNQVVIAQNRASFGLVAFAVFQIGALIAALSLIDFEDGHAATRIAVAVLGSFGLTIACGILIYPAFVLFR